MRQARMDRVREQMDRLGVDALLLSHGADLPWLTGYRAMPLERLTMLVLRPEGEPVLVEEFTSRAGDGGTYQGEATVY